MRRLETLIAGTSLVTATALGGAWRSATTVPAVLTPGSRDITTTHVRSAGFDFRYLMRMPTGDTTEREVGAGRSELAQTRHEGKPAFVLISSTERNGVKYLDSALVMQDGLAPVWETARRGATLTRWDYDGREVRVTITSPDSGTRARQHSYDVPVFNFQELDLVIRSVPLREGYEVILPLYSEGSDLLEMDSLRVMKPGDGGVWSVRFADPAIVSTYGIDGKTREIVSHDVLQRKSGAHMRKVVIK